ncbi:TniQ family protein [Paracoccus litorisediminis]|uniref:TniQ domain-containing protein n=1 Tax=Paracoccus litorisediminis TaxID=2006130 RepID=A0A844HRT3_9RHOB|nr:TniQ family protein [Paracoccus litorisediminis]MTH60905.1 hypothetical protein [Paracoccus litorisediminis]
MAALPLTMRLDKSEGAASYLSRLASRNFCSVEEFCADLGLSLAEIRDGKASALAQLAMLAGISAQDLVFWTPRHLDAHTTSWCCHDLTRSRFSGKEIRGCPQCLREDVAGGELPPEHRMYLRSDWSHEFRFTCLRHGCWLVPLWQEEDARQRSDIASRLQALGQEALADQRFDLPVEPSAFDRWFVARLSAQPTSTWLGQFDLQASLDFCDLLGRTLTRDRFPQLGDMTRRDRWQAMSLGFEIAAKGEEALRAKFAEMQQVQGAPQDGPQKRFGVLYGNLNRYHTGLAYLPFRTILRDHIISTWPIAAGQQILGEALPERRLHSVLTAARETGYSPERVRAILAAHGHVPAKSEGKINAWEVFPASPAMDLLRRVGQGVTVKAVQQALNITPSQINTLRMSGYLEPSVSGNGHRPLWDLAAAETFLGKLSAGAVPVEANAPDWEEIGALALRLRIPPGDIIRMRFEGRLASIGARRGVPGYRGIVVRPSEVEAKLARSIEDHLNIEDLSKRIGLRWPQARRLVMAGLTPSTILRNPASGAMQHYISLEDLTAFRSRFVTLLTLAEEMGVHWQKLSGPVRKLGIPRFQHDGKEFGQLYARSDIPSDWLQGSPP